MVAPTLTNSNGAYGLQCMSELSIYVAKSIMLITRPSVGRSVGHGGVESAADSYRSTGDVVDVRRICRLTTA